jgi:hypothetical protein
MLSAFVHGEAELAAITGMHPKQFQKARIKHLAQGTHWDLNAMRVAYCEAGVSAVLEKICGRPGPFSAELLDRSRLADPAAEKKEPAALIGKVTKLFPNPRLMQVQLDADESLVNVSVKETKNFRRGMVVPVRLDANGRYVLARRLPRFAGRW